MNVNTNDLTAHLGNIGDLGDKEFDLLFNLVLFEKARRYAQNKPDGIFSLKWNASAEGRIQSGVAHPTYLSFKLKPGGDHWDLPF